MTRSSPLRRSQFSSPDRGYRSSFLYDERNTELSHRDALAAAQAEHDRIREAALRVYELHELKEEHQRILDQERREQERLKAEAEIAAEERRLQELRAKTIPKPAPPPPTPEPPKAAERPQPEKPASAEVRKADVAPAQAQHTAKAAAAQPNGILGNQVKPAAASPFGVSPASVSAPKAVLTTPAPQSKPATRPQTALQTQPQARPPAKPAADRYVQIHQELKKLRKDITAQSKVPGSPLKGKMGTFRREIRVAIGQLTGGKGANAQPTSKIMSILRESLGGQVPSPPIQVSGFVVESREPVEGAAYNDETLPSLFIYLMNICAKGVINQFINECGPNPKAADPIGVFTAQVFSHKDFQWRGQSLIDILIAKFRIVCPVLFGFRGSDKTERGRLAIGWRKDGPSWITEQSHNDRMAGLGAGFASISLRDFSKASKVNPYPPTHYWTAFAGIVNSPPNETSNTQYVVLRSMIDGHEQRFLNFYGNAAVAALRLALVEFPKQAPQNASAAGSLLALAEVLKVEGGLVLA
ncbi:RNA export mediator Gle1 [Purpureocillium lavendulum]|uniref:mRNA export factor GLE1 n=1 Tax=Purpureocillium lavendulum TaxID=1247861 RepID=A0AB34FI96_9HYPO|nr:RNA export mediator Gle1 [Purpureocillium lavendulum]